MPTTLTVKTGGLNKEVREITITIPQNGVTASEFVEYLVQPAMLALLYHPVSVREALGEEPE